MPLILSLNDLSCASTLRPAEIDGCMNGFVDLLLAVRRLRPDSSLITPERLPTIELGNGYPMSRWAADGRNRDRWRLLQRMQDRAPYRFADVAPDLGADDHEYQHGADPAPGLGIAHRVGGLAVSLATDERWSPPEVQLVRVWIDRADEAVTVRHASGPAHLDTHRGWLTNHDVDAIATGLQLWTARADLLPDVSFLPGVEANLAALQPMHLDAVRRRLMEIQDAVRAWDPAAGAQPRWHSLITPEHQQRKRLCEFADLDGVVRVFDLHARYTPGPGRVHFRLIEEHRSVRVAYIGRKLGS